jgi:hypothetical protein
MTLMIPGTNVVDYKTPGPQGDSLRTCRITFDNLVDTGAGEGLDGVITLQWFLTRYVGGIPPGRVIPKAIKSGVLKALRAIQFAKNITGSGLLSVGGALSSATVKISLLQLDVEDKVVPPYQPVIANIEIATTAKTAAGDSIGATLQLAIHPDNPVNYRLTYYRTPHRGIKAEVDTTP